MEKSWLTKEEEDSIKKYLIDFVKRVSSEETYKRGYETYILPEITRLLLNNYVSDK